PRTPFRLALRIHKWPHGIANKIVPRRQRRRRRCLPPPRILVPAVPRNGRMRLHNPANASPPERLDMERRRFANKTLPWRVRNAPDPAMEVRVPIAISDGLAVVAPDHKINAAVRRPIPLRPVAANFRRPAHREPPVFGQRMHARPAARRRRTRGVEKFMLAMIV